MRTSRPSSFRLALASIIAALALVVAPSLPAGAAPPTSPPGNSAGAKACQKGGWMQLAGSEDPFAGFVDQSSCVSYAAAGGALAPLQEQAVPYVDVTIAPYDGTSCRITMTLIGSADGVPVGVTVDVTRGGGVLQFRPILEAPSQTSFTGPLYAGDYLSGARANILDPNTYDEREPIDINFPTTVCGA